MTKHYTAAELSEFDGITADMSSQDQMTRISARLAIKKFVEKHGKEKCDAMFEELEKRDAR